MGYLITEKSFVTCPDAGQLIFYSVIFLLVSAKVLDFSLEGGNNGVFLIEARRIIFGSESEGSLAGFASESAHCSIIEINLNTLPPS